VHGGVIFTIDPSVPDAIAAMSEAVRGMLAAREAFTAEA
jgi:hypothetical protein